MIGRCKSTRVIGQYDVWYGMSTTQPRDCCVLFSTWFRKSDSVKVQRFLMCWRSLYVYALLERKCSGNSSLRSLGVVQLCLGCGLVHNLCKRSLLKSTSKLFSQNNTNSWENHSGRSELTPVAFILIYVIKYIIMLSHVKELHEENLESCHLPRIFLNPLHDYMKRRWKAEIM